MPEFPEGLNFDLANAFTRDIEIFANLFQGPLATVGIEAEAQPDHFLLTRAEGLQHVAGYVASIRVNYTLGGTDTRLIFDEVTDLRLTGFANRRLERDG